MPEGDIESVLLYRTPEKWRISVKVVRGDLVCGALSGASPDVPVKVAQEEFLSLLRDCWHFEGRLIWRQTEPDWWAAEPDPATRKPTIT